MERLFQRLLRVRCPFVYSDAIAVLKNLRSYYGDQIWKRYGFVDAFNPLTGWVSRDVLGIDVGITMLMAENARSQFVWNTFMRNPEVRIAMDRAGFRALGEQPPLLRQPRKSKSRRLESAQRISSDLQQVVNLELIKISPLVIRSALMRNKLLARVRPEPIHIQINHTGW